jgi:hypothetical protein
MAIKHCRRCGGLKPSPKVEVYRLVALWVAAGFIAALLGPPVAALIRSHCLDHQREVYGLSLRPIELTDGNRDIHWCRLFVP